MKNPIQNGTLIALAAATLFAAACGGRSASSSTTPSAQEKTASVHCMGINACKAQGACKSTQNECKGHNACKGQGVVETASAEECTSKGGTVAAR